MSGPGEKIFQEKEPGEHITSIVPFYCALNFVLGAGYVFYVHDLIYSSQ